MKATASTKVACSKPVYVNVPLADTMRQSDRATVHRPSAPFTIGRPQFWQSDVHVPRSVSFALDDRR
jgi:hypothetical protein